ncbi:phosphopantetheine-binding protein [Micromonospora marina]|uniref:Diaminopimelate decarboxylase n=1 Tax=Micromonospora marina TaxID=307120 RepID=A0A1C5AIE1_9ACTN|nr:phosphopantetheine-binding protein [Micromonospora marina]SCF44973.1 diaminopimelate decarboxylase [Micromonospora marina]
MTSDIDWVELATQYGTPTYVYDGAELAGQFRRLRDAVHDSLEIFFSLKSNPNRSFFEVLQFAGARAEVSSLAELRTVLAAGADPANIIFLGPGKSETEIAACVEAGIYAIVCESFDELDHIDRAAGERGVRQRVLIRVNPAAPIAGSRLSMGGKPRQFGIDEEAVLASGGTLTGYRHADVAGIHAYLGTRILDHGVILANTAYVLDLADRIVESTGIRLDAVDIGGGLGVGYFDNENDLDLEGLAAELNPLVDKFATGHPDTRLMLESGRYLAAGCGTYLMRVRYTKKSRGVSFAVTDGGTHQHMAAIGIGSFVKRNFPIDVLSGSAGEPGPTDLWTISGPLCTPNDTIAKAVALPALKPGDLLGVRRSGAYGPSASPVYFLSHGHPAEVLLWRGRSFLVRRRDTVEDVLERQVVHPGLIHDAPPSDRIPKLGENMSSAIDAREIREFLRSELSTILDKDLPDLTDDMNLLHEVGLDSIEVVEVLMAMEDSLGLVIDPDELSPEIFETVGSLTTYIRASLANAPADAV